MGLNRLGKNQLNSPEFADLDYTKANCVNRSQLKQKLT